MKTGNLARWLSIGLALAELKRSRISNPIGLAEKVVTNESLFVNAQHAPFSRSKASVDMNANTNWNQMMEEHEIAFLHGDICLGPLQSYSLEEKKRICADMETSAAAIDAVLKANFESLPPEAQGMLLDMLCASGCMTPEFWKETLIGKMPDSVEMLETVRL